MSYRHKKLKEEDVAVCECKYGVNDLETACGERFLNVLTIIECTLGYYLSGENCRNQSPNAIFSFARHGTLPYAQCFACCSQRFQKCEYAKTKLFRTKGHGWGILADENIKTVNHEYCREVLSSEVAKKMCLAYEAHKVKDVYIMSLNANFFIDATKKGSLARFINHSWEVLKLYQPNCETRKWIVLGETRVGIFAKRDISFGCYNINSYPCNSWIFISIWLSYCRYIMDNLLLYDMTNDDESSAVISGTSGGNEHTKVLNDSEASTFTLEPTNRCNHAWEERDNIYIMDNLPLYDTTDDDESSPVISGTSGGNEHTKILNDVLTSIADPGWKYGKRTSETNRATIECNFCKKVTNGRIFHHKQHLIGTCRDVSQCEQCPDVVREEMKKYVDEKKEKKRQALLQSDVTNIGDDKDKDMEEDD
ncbi:hypothetical protein R3W88_024433 [Solanum pinnatisectum]|uniref:SET domain-containing protein n=1 Tax=Solanum pinnatisectum TaxID=50273 RepID=A0AAV9M3C1_9SOLN|nr:hypothetical protein R3W88_024433 [Solanum pinnatisectum]